MPQTELRMPDLKKILQVLNRYKVILIVLAVGLLLILLPDRSTGMRVEDTLMEYETSSLDIEELENRMEKILSRIEGTGNLSLLLTVKGEEEKIYAANTEYREDEDSLEERLEVVTISTGSGTEQPLIKKRNYPAFQGALVVCDGGDDPDVRLLVTKAVAALTGLGTDRITVCR